MINFDIILAGNIYVYDVSPVNVNESYAIDVLTVNVTCKRFNVNTTFDAKAYILSQDRESYEILKVIPSQLGASTFRDGMYEITYVLDNSTTRQSITKNYILYPNVQAKYDELVAKYDYSVSVGTYNIEYVGAEAQEKTEQINIVNALLAELKNFDMNAKEVDVTRVLTKLERMLEIINN